MDEKERLVAVEERSKSNTHRIDKLENTFDEIKELTIAVKEIAMETKANREDLSDINNRLKTIEEKPVKNWDNLTKTIITRNSSSGSGLFFSKNGIIGGYNHEKENINMYGLFACRSRCFVWSVLS